MADQLASYLGRGEEGGVNTTSVYEVTQSTDITSSSDNYYYAGAEILLR